jgi:uncharacterized membrane-anchored protein
MTDSHNADGTINPTDLELPDDPFVTAVDRGRRNRPATGWASRPLLNKVPEVTIFFWIIKILCTTVGESAADFLNVNLNWGLTNTSIAVAVVFFAVFALQLGLKRYVATVYWLTVMLISVLGTLLTDNLTDNLGVPLQTSTIVFSILLSLVFLAWYASEKTLSIHSIYTRRREMFYWLAVLVTFALGTAVGDLISEGLGVGYFKTGLLCAALIGVITVAWRLGLDAVLAFWLAYILTRPLGASIGDLMAQPTSNGGLNLGVTVTSLILLALIVVTIVYLSVKKPDVIDVPDDPIERARLDEPETAPHHRPESRRTAMIQTAVTLVLVVVVGGWFYTWRSSALDAEAAAATTTTAASTTPSAAASPLGDMTQFVTITQDTLDKLTAGDQAAATARITDLETAWDNAQATLKRRNADAWTGVDGKIDTVLRELRSTSPNPTTETAALQALLTQMAPVASTSAAVGGVTAVPAASPLGDMSQFIVITQDTLDMLNAGKQADATARITDLESAWDNAQATLKRRNADAWTGVDDKIDVVLRELRSTSPNPTTEEAALKALLTQMGA